MPVFRPLRMMRRHFAPTGFPFTRVRIYDAAPSSGGRLLADFDLTGCTTQTLGSDLVLESTVSTTVLLNGMPSVARFLASDLTTVIADQAIVQPAAVTNADQQVVQDSVPDTQVLDPGLWLKDTPVSLGPGDITYQP